MALFDLEEPLGTGSLNLSTGSTLPAPIAPWGLEEAQGLTSSDPFSAVLANGVPTIADDESNALTHHLQSIQTHLNAMRALSSNPTFQQATAVVASMANAVASNKPPVLTSPSFSYTPATSSTTSTPAPGNGILLPCGPQNPSSGTAAVAVHANNNTHPPINSASLPSTPSPSSQANQIHAQVPVAAVLQQNNMGPLSLTNLPTKPMSSASYDSAYNSSASILNDVKAEATEAHIKPMTSSPRSPTSPGRSSASEAPPSPRSQTSGRVSEVISRRQAHNAVERRRRTKISMGMTALKQVLPNCGKSTAMTQAVMLEKAVTHIKSLITTADTKGREVAQLRDAVQAKRERDRGQGESSAKRVKVEFEELDPLHL
eukprot:TRINITY_DN66234_c11_g6_i1.p1 TRINITY_DN66234_c11_g6~~TRINITY_DN66234_c11_g6_i1.p1  ORF type:complete len:373 (+),score=33.24 TRINITY_DN66234_c11_g6_i1:27-1145(+)